jgi:hypothetical protein
MQRALKDRGIQRVLVKPHTVTKCNRLDRGATQYQYVYLGVYLGDYEE